jgi:hypothetical protein
LCFSPSPSSRPTQKRRRAGCLRLTLEPFLRVQLVCLRFLLFSSEAKCHDMPKVSSMSMSLLALDGLKAAIHHALPARPQHAIVSDKRAEKEKGPGGVSPDKSIHTQRKPLVRLSIALRFLRFFFLLFSVCFARFILSRMSSSHSGRVSRSRRKASERNSTRGLFRAFPRAEKERARKRSSGGVFVVYIPHRRRRKKRFYEI